MGILALAADERIADVEVSEDELSVRLRDGRKISVPLVWYPRLLHATEEQRNHWEIAGAGYGIRWEEIDEDLSAEGLLRGAPAPRQSPRAPESNPKMLINVPADSKTKKSKALSVEESKHIDTKGILDHLIEGADAANELDGVLQGVTSETTRFTAKIDKHTANLTRLGKNPSRLTLGDFNRLLLLTASDMNAFSQRVEQVLPKLEKSTNILDESYSFYVNFTDPESPVEKERISSLLHALAVMLDTVRSAKEQLAYFRNSTTSIRKQNLNSELNKAADRQFKTLDNLVLETERIESFALRISFLIEEKFGFGDSST